MILLNLLQQAQQVIHSTLLSDRAIDHLINGGLFTGTISVLHTLNRKSGKRADHERRKEIEAIKETQRITTLATERIAAMATERDTDVRQMIADLSNEVRALTIMVRNGLSENVKDIKERLTQMEHRELERAERARDKSA